MTIEYIKTKNACYYPTDKRSTNKYSWLYKPVCYIKKLWFGRWQIDYYDPYTEYETKGFSNANSNQSPNVRLVVFPS